MRLIAIVSAHDDEAGGEMSGDCGAAGQVVEGVAQHLEHDQHQERGDRRRRHRLVLPVAVGMVLVGRPSGRADADQPDDVRGGVGQGVEAVREDADRAAE